MNIIDNKILFPVVQFYSLYNLVFSFVYICVVPENIHTPPQKGLEIPGGRGRVQRPKNSKKCMEFNWNCQRGGFPIKNPYSVGGMDNSMELHIIIYYHITKNCTREKLIHISFTVPSRNI